MAREVCATSARSSTWASTSRRSPCAWTTHSPGSATVSLPIRSRLSGWRGGRCGGRVSEHRKAAFDLLVIGGGINGAGIARDAAGRGLRVMLVEQDDLASATSQSSSKLIHGGLRYLEHGEFGLVREALREREVLLRLAPHLVRPLNFVVPHDAAMRPLWMIRTGLWLYDHI